jgi:hypothetical protein
VQSRRRVVAFRNQTPLRRTVHYHLVASIALANHPAGGGPVHDPGQGHVYRSAIGFFEMTRAGQHIVERTLAPFEIFTLVGALFVTICYAGSSVSRRLERRLSRAAPAGESEWRYVFGAR